MKNIKEIITVKDLMFLGKLSPVNHEVEEIIQTNHIVVGVLLTEVLEMATPENRPSFYALIETYNDMCISLIVESGNHYVGYNLLGGEVQTQAEVNIGLLKDVFIGLSVGLIGARKASRGVYWEQPNLAILKDIAEKYYQGEFKEAKELLEDIIDEFNSVCPKASAASFDATSVPAYVSSFSGAINRYKTAPKSFEIKGYLPVENPTPQYYEVRVFKSLLRHIIATDLNATYFIENVLEDKITLVMTEYDTELFGIFTWAGSLYKSNQSTMGFKDEIRIDYERAKFVFESVDFNPIRLEHLLGAPYTPFTKPNADLIKAKFNNYISEVYHD